MWLYKNPTNLGITIRFTTKFKSLHREGITNTQTLTFNFTISVGFTVPHTYVTTEVIVSQRISQPQSSPISKYYRLNSRWIFVILFSVRKIIITPPLLTSFSRRREGVMSVETSTRKWTVPSWTWSRKLRLHFVFHIWFNRWRANNFGH